MLFEFQKCHSGLLIYLITRDNYLHVILFSLPEIWCIVYYDFEWL